MRRTQTLWLGMLLVAMSAAWGQVEVKPFLSPLFDDHAVLQRDRTIPVWGWTTPGEQVSVTIDGKTTTAKAGDDGRWEAGVGPLRAWQFYEMTVSSPSQTVVRRDLLGGDVWICSGQSNMEMGLNAISAPGDVSDANQPALRLFMVPNRISTSPLSTVDATWNVCRPETVKAGGWGGFSAVGYYFGRELLRRLDVPIGLIDTNWGGTIAQAWTSEASLRKMGDFDQQLDALAAQRASGQTGEQAMIAWWRETVPTLFAANGWGAVGGTATGFSPVTLPGDWTATAWGAHDGLAYYRREVTLPADWAGQAATLSLGPIDDRDVTLINGQVVGSGMVSNANRNYTVPAGLLRAGTNVIAIAALDTGGAGGLTGQPAQLQLTRPGAAAIPLAGAWQGQQGAALNAMAAPPPAVPDNNPNFPTLLYNGMISPLVPLGVTGAIWYQGESNVGNAEQYSRLLPTLIGDWRQQFRNKNLGFYIVQLANFLEAKPEPSESAWAELREAQDLTGETVARAGLANTIDIGNPTDIHPINKLDVGRRLAYAALARTYGRKLVYSGPRLRSATYDGNTARVGFDHVGGGLMARDGELRGFALRDAAGQWAWATGYIEGNQVVLTAPGISEPVAVRYDWADNPNGNLYNAEGLPAVPFRTDTPYKALQPRAPRTSAAAAAPVEAEAPTPGQWPMSHTVR